MELRELGEFGLIVRLAEEAVVAPQRVQVAIGDDCAVVPGRDGLLSLCTTDMLVEGIHFLRAQISPRQLGAKAMTVNLSDIAAMGGRPLDAFLSLAIPPDLGLTYLEALLAGIKSTAAAAAVNLLGGDTTASLRDLVLSITLTGEIDPERLLLRRGGRPGDLLWVSGTLGDSAAGLDALLHDRAAPTEVAPLVHRHREPRAYLAEGQAIAASGLAHAMLDLSDGLSSDLGHLCAASGVGCVIDAARLPLSAALRTYCAAHRLEPLDFALNGGEDYLLLVAGSPALGATLAAGGVGLWAIGELVAGAEQVCRLPDGEVRALEPRGWDHFRSGAPRAG